MQENSNPFFSVGREIKDEYGRVVGKIASFAVTPNGKIDAAFIEQTDGKFLKYPLENLQFNGGEVILTSWVKSKANVFCDQIPLIWRKDQALKDLVDKNKISSELYQELHSSFEGALTQLKNDAQSLMEQIDKEIAKCIEEIKALNYALVNLEIEHEIGKIDDGSYQKAFDIIQDNIKRVNIEKSDLEAIKNKLSNILLGDSPKVVEPKIEEAKTETSSVPDLPEPPVVVYVKEIGKSGI
ncbi:MAG: CdvA-like protein [Candidatus Bathyarchaeia archaeon]